MPISSSYMAMSSPIIHKCYRTKEVDTWQQKLVPLASGSTKVTEKTGKIE